MEISNTLASIVPSVNAQQQILNDIVALMNSQQGTLKHIVDHQENQAALTSQYNQQLNSNIAAQSLILKKFVEQ